MKDKWNDNTKMTFGKKYRGKKLIEIPDDYFIWFWEQNRHKYKAEVLDGDVLRLMEYIEDSFEDLPK